MRLIPRTILGRLFAGTLIVQVLVFACFLIFGVSREIGETDARNAERLHHQAVVLAELSAEALHDNDEGQLSTVFHSVQITSLLRGARLTDLNGTTVRVSQSDLPSELSPEERGKLFDVRTHGGYRVLDLQDGSSEAVQTFDEPGAQGIVWLYPDAAVATRAPRQVVRYGAVYGVCALVGNLLLIWALSTSIARPLRRLRQASLGVVQAPDDLSAFPLVVRGRGETAELTDSVNTMVAEIERQRSSTRETLALLDSMLRNAPIGFAFFDREMRYVRLNQNLADAHGLSVAAHIGRTARELSPPSMPGAVIDEKEHWIRHVFDTGEVLHDRELAGEAPGKPGTRRAWRDTFYPVRTHSNEVRWVGVIVTEVTERLQSEEALRRSEKLAAAGRLAASIAHEINNPLESVTNLLYLLSMEADLAHAPRSYVELAQQELARVAEITQQTLRFYRQSSLPLDTRPAEVLRSVLVLHQGKLHAASVEVKRRIDDGVVLFGYTGEMRQLFANLVGNAIDAMPKGGELHLRVRQGTRAGQRGIWVTVADTGMGMPDAVRLRIFEPFFTTKDATGTGLGLWVSLEIIQKHRGTVQVRSRAVVSRPGQISLVQAGTTGTVFRLFFPADGVPRGPVAVRSARQLGTTLPAA